LNIVDFLGAYEALGITALGRESGSYVGLIDEKTMVENFLALSLFRRSCKKFKSINNSFPDKYCTSMEESERIYKEEIEIKTDMEFSSCTPEEEDEQVTR
jgi:hypothetical protein